jgi:hypothetical protein
MIFTSSIPHCLIFYNKRLSPAVIAGYDEGGAVWVGNKFYMAA